jgi:hypothetical protein
MSDSILISYPSGGFGHFIFHVLTEHAEETVKPLSNEFKFSSTGDSHSTNVYTDIYFNDPDQYHLAQFDKTALILCDNGINNDGYIKIRKHFPNERIVRIVIDDFVRPVIYQTCVIKAMRESVESQQIMSAWSDSDEDYAKRENFTLLYHNWPFKWNRINESNVINFSLEQLIKDTYTACCDLINQLGLSIYQHERLLELCQKWQEANAKYISIYNKWNEINQTLDTDADISVEDITDLHEQGYINYCLEKKFDCIIPVYDYRHWFKTTKEMRVFA